MFLAIFYKFLFYQFRQKLFTLECNSAADLFRAICSVFTRPSTCVKPVTKDHFNSINATQGREISYYIMQYHAIKQFGNLAKHVGLRTPFWNQFSKAHALFSVRSTGESFFGQTLFLCYNRFYLWKQFSPTFCLIFCVLCDFSCRCFENCMFLFLVLFCRAVSKIKKCFRFEDLKTWFKDFCLRELKEIK